MTSANKYCQSCKREFSIFIRPYCCELCNENRFCSNCARKFVLSYNPDPSYLRLCDQCCLKISSSSQENAFKSVKKSKNKKKVKNSSGVWSFASSFIGRSPSKSYKQSKAIQSQNTQSIDISKSPPISCYCITKTKKNATNNNSAEHMNHLKDQAPLFPENYTIFTRKKQNSYSDEHDNKSDDVYYHTMHPLNNLKLQPPKSILSASVNQIAINISINKGENHFYVRNLEKTSLCDCFSYTLRKKQNVQSTEDDNFDDDDNEPQNKESEHEYKDEINRFCHCITIPIKNKKFKLLRIDFLFDKFEYHQLINNNNDNAKKHRIAINVILYDHDSSMWSGVQIVTVEQFNLYQIISKISVNCYQTLIKKSVQITGSMAWQIADDHESEQNESNERLMMNYPYKMCSASQMVSILTQQRFDIIDSYETVIERRHSLQNKQDMKSNSVEPVRKNQIRPKEDGEKNKELMAEDIPADGGSNAIPTKRSESFGDENEKRDSRLNDERNKNVIDDNDEHNALLPTCSSRHPGIMVQEMEKNMLQQEIARIDSMMMGLEQIGVFISNDSNEHHNANNNNHVSSFDEVTASMASSDMFSANELRTVKLQIAQHLNNENIIQDIENINNSEQEKKPIIQNPNNTADNNMYQSIPICLSCQRCSRTIVLCEPVNK